MPISEIFHLLPDDKDIASMQQPDSLLVPSKPDSPHHQENQSKRQRNDQQEDQEQEEEAEQEQEKLQDESRKKRKWECDDEASRDIPETPRKSNIRCNCPPRPPRKPKATPAMKRRAMWLKRSVVYLDVARDVESMFPPSVLQDFGKKIKKARS